MDKVFWVIDGQLAGRPGPDQDPWRLDALKTGGIGAVLSVNDGVLCHPRDFEAMGMSYACIPMSDNAPPFPGDHERCIKALPLAYEFAESEIDKGMGVLVHCSAGKDRTGLFLSYFLMRQYGFTITQAIGRVREVRPIALSAEGWDEFAPQVLSRCS
ncbi:MAG: dual specificity protein phosphatase family protein [Gammaproteobacteria bacterium]|nr:dual specificity protein phosphatase family protein [Gammaproteobacteria bacterium]